METKAHYHPKEINDNWFSIDPTCGATQLTALPANVEPVAFTREKLINAVDA